MKGFLRNLALIAVVAFILQGIWEYTVCGLFYTMSNLGHTRLMLSATFGDMVMSIALYGLLVFVNRDVNWVNKKWRRHDYVITTLYALFLSFYFEISALQIERWGYDPIMPIIPTTPIAFLPVLQLLILLPIIFALTKQLNKKLSSSYKSVKS
ncbi:MAG: hypothetical protein APF84_19345 [Gracilibacter sp. BRH_c7a]|nr:MAG: hypothetical protein APF84_19345 [Gracilibacter sp. BRH_c7a]